MATDAQPAERSAEAPLVLVVDDEPASRRLLEAVLVAAGHRVVTAVDGRDALTVVSERRPDLVLLDLRLPDIDGLEVCRRLRADDTTVALPVLMLTAAGSDERLAALDSGADDFVTKPFDRAELLARVRSLLRIKRYQDTIESQAAELARFNADLEARVAEQLLEMERLGRLRRFLSPSVADLVISADEPAMLDTHRAEIAVLFADLRGFVRFTHAAEPEDVMTVLGEFHDAIGALVRRHGATVGNLAGDGVMLFFGDPLPCPDPAARAVDAAIELRAAVSELVPEWRRRGHDLDVGQGVAVGFATLGVMGFDGRVEYGVVGNVVNLAARLCSEAASGEILLDQRARLMTESSIESAPVGSLTLKGFADPVPAWRIGDGEHRARVSHVVEQPAAADNEFRRDGEYWTVSYRATTVRLRDVKGLHYLARLLAQPGREIHVTELAGEGATVRVGDAGPMLDARARDAYQRRYDDLQHELEEAEQWGDGERAARAAEELDALAHELSSAFGLGGRPRAAADPMERVRKAVTNRIRDSIAKIERVHPTLGRHLTNAVRTGTYCSYEPESGTAWQL